MAIHVSHALINRGSPAEARLPIPSVHDIALDPGVHDKKIARNFDPAFAARLMEVCNLLKREGYNFDIGSGVRTVQSQRLQQRLNPYASHGLHSKHLYGCAVDLFHAHGDGHSDKDFYRALHRAARQYRLQPINGRRERSHIQIPNHEFFAGLRAGRFRILAAWGHAVHDIFSRHTRNHGRHHRHLHGWRHHAILLTRHGHHHYQYRHRPTQALIQHHRLAAGSPA